MNRFNLTFSGEILSGEQPREVRQRFAEAFQIADPERLERFFSGEPIILRRNLERKEAAQCYQEMRRLGIVAELVKVTPEELAWEETARRHRAKTSAAPAPVQSGETLLPVSDSTAEATQPAPTAKPARKKNARNKTRRAAAPLAGNTQGIENAEHSADAADRQLELQLAQNKAAETNDQAQGQQEQRATKQRAAREKKARAMQQRSARKDAAQRKAAAAAQRKAERERSKASAKAQQQARRAQREQQKAAQKAALEAEQQARQAQAEREAAAALEQQHIAEQQAQRLLAARRAEEEAARQQAAEEAARQRILRDIEQARRSAAEQQERAGLEEGAIERGAAELTRGAAIKPVQARVKSRLGVPLKDSTWGSGSKGAAPRRRKPNEPNFYTLNAFRVTAAIRERAQRARRAARTGLQIAVLGCAGLLLLGIVRWQLPAAQPFVGIQATATDSAGNLYLLAGKNLLKHDRAGVAATAIALESLGVAALSPPLRFSADDQLYAVGSLAADAAASQLLRCDLAQGACQVAVTLPQGSRVDNYQLHPLDGSVFIADAGNDQLLQFDRQGNLLAQAAVPLPALPALALHSGLLFVNSNVGPAIRVLRYDSNAFGEQLDEALLLPAPAVEAGLDRSGDFLFHREQWWVVLYQQATGNAGVFRFDESWATLGALPAAPDRLPVTLSRWGEKLLVQGSNAQSLARFNTVGQPEAKFESTLLQQLRADHKQRQRLQHIALNGAGLVAVLLLLWGLWMRYINRLRSLVYKSGKERGAAPVDEIADDLEWIEIAPRRTLALRRRLISGCLLGAACCLVAIGFGTPTSQLLALVIVLAGPLIGLLLVMRSPVGHIGTYHHQLMLVDHAQHYQLGAGADIQYRGGFLMLHDVVVYCGNALLPAFHTMQVNQTVAPLARGAVKVDRGTLLVKLLQARPPVMQAVLAIAACLLAATLCLLWPWLFASLP
ncbi:MAG: hypothetical protein NXI15_00475 [Gammaproteobacteria bacterium]|nr:hypothetical protein [Gammaproteobacteria bacterium]